MKNKDKIKLYNKIMESVSSSLRKELYIDDYDIEYTKEDMEDFISYLIKDFDITKEVTKEDLNDIYNNQDLNDIYINSKLSNGFLYNINKYDINEALDTSDLKVRYSLTYEQILKNLREEYNIKSWQIRQGYEYDKEYPNINIYKPIPTCNIVSGKFKDNIDIMNKLMGEYGYIYFRHYVKEVDGMDFIYIIYNPMFPDDVNEYIRCNIDVLFHASPIYNHESIIKNGFQPNERNDEYTYYPGRVFFKMGRTGLNGFIKMLSSIADRYMDINPTREFNIYSIESDKIVDKYKFYRDSNAKESCFTNSIVSYNDGFKIFKTIKV